MTMRRVSLALFVGVYLASQPALAGQSDGGYRLVPNWPKPVIRGAQFYVYFVMMGAV